MYVYKIIHVNLNFPIWRNLAESLSPKAECPMFVHPGMFPWEYVLRESPIYPQVQTKPCLNTHRAFDKKYYVTFIQIKFSVLGKQREWAPRTGHPAGPESLANNARPHTGGWQRPNDISASPINSASSIAYILDYREMSPDPNTPP